MELDKGHSTCKQTFYSGHVCVEHWPVKTKFFPFREAHLGMWSEWFAPVIRAGPLLSDNIKSMHGVTKRVSEVATCQLGWLVASESTCLSPFPHREVMFVTKAPVTESAPHLPSSQVEFVQHTFFLPGLSGLGLSAQPSQIIALGIQRNFNF